MIGGAPQYFCRFRCFLRKNEEVGFNTQIPTNQITDILLHKQLIFLKYKIKV
jgi:hypothetical protein